MRAVNPRVHRIQQELLAMHGARAMIRGVNRRPHPLEVADLVSSYLGMNVRRLRRKRRPDLRSGDRQRQVIRRSLSQRLVNIRQMFAIKLVKVAVVRRMVLRTVPPVPVTALRDQNLLEGQLALRLVRTRRILRIELACVVEIVPGAIVFGSADPDVEI